MAACITWTDVHQRQPQQSITGVSGRLKFVPHGHDHQQTTPSSSSASKRVDHRTKNKAIQEIFLTVGSKSTMKLVFADPPTGHPRLLNDPKDLVDAMVVYTRGVSTFAAKYEQAVSFGAQCIVVINDNDDHPFTVISVAGTIHYTLLSLLIVYDEEVYYLFPVYALTLNHFPFNFSPLQSLTPSTSFPSTSFPSISYPFHIFPLNLIFFNVRSDT